MTYSHAEWIANHRDAWLAEAYGEIAADLFLADLPQPTNVGGSMWLLIGAA